MSMTPEVQSPASPRATKDRTPTRVSPTHIYTEFKEGEAVRIVDRAPVAADAKSGLYFSHYRNLCGRVFQLFGQGDTQQAAIEIDEANLPADIASRHAETRDRMINSLSAEARRQSQPGTPSEFRLRYIILVAVQDLIAAG